MFLRDMKDPKDNSGCGNTISGKPGANLKDSELDEGSGNTKPKIDIINLSD